MITSTEMRDYQRTIDAVYVGSNLKSELSMSAWRDRTRQTVQCVKVLRDELNAKYEAERDKFSDKENERRESEMLNERSVFEDIARAKIEKDLENVISAKKAAFSKAMGAPDDESIRLLQVLSMRQNVSAPEIAATAEHLNGNLQALSVLSEIAKKNNIAFPRLETDFTTLEQELRAAAGDLLHTIFDDDNYYSRLFLTESSTGGKLAPFIRALDNPAYLDVAQIKSAEEPTTKDMIREAVAQGVAFAIDQGGGTDAVA